jgi:hypothetical protein
VHQGRQPSELNSSEHGKKEGRGVAASALLLAPIHERRERGCPEARLEDLFRVIFCSSRKMEYILPIRMSTAKVRQLGEGQTIEFKASLHKRARQEAMEGLCGMVNTDAAHGSVIFGVSDDGAIRGIEGNLDSNQRTLNQHIRDSFHPEIIPSIEIIECDNKTLLRVEAKRVSGVSLHAYDGRVWIKEGSEKRYLNHEEQIHFRRKRDRDSHTGRWKCSGCGTVTDSFNSTDQFGNRNYDCMRCFAGEFQPI